MLLIKHFPLQKIQANTLFLYLWKQ